jgi:hypothetical protein
MGVFDAFTGGLVGASPFGEGKVLGPQHPVGGDEARPGREVDPLTGERAEEHRDDFLYGGYQGGAQDFNAQTQGIASGYGQQMQGVGQAYGGQFQNNAQQYGNDLGNLGHGQYGEGTALTSMGRDTLGNVDANAYVDPNSLYQSNQAAANMGGQAASMDVAAGQLLNMDFSGPSVAEAQLNAGAQQTANQNLALAQSGRGMGGGAAARRAAMRQNAQVMGETNAQAAGLRANEAATQRAQKMQAVQAGGQMYGAAGSLYGQQAGVGSQNLGTLAGARQGAVSDANQLGLGLTNTGVGAMQAGANTAAAGANAQTNALQAGANTQLGALQGGASTELGGQQLSNQTNTAALGGTMGFEADMTGRRGQTLHAQEVNQQNQKENQAASVGLVGEVLGGIVSDRTAKTDVKRIPVDARIFGGGSGAQGSEASRFADALTGWKRSMGMAEDKPVGETGYTQFARTLARREPSGVRAEHAAAAARAGGNERVSATPYGGPTEAEYQAARAWSQPASSYGGVDIAALDEANRRARSNYGASSPSPEAASHAIDQANPYTFDYKDPERHGEGRRLGVMAQDLEKTPAGSEAVMRAPDGTRMISDPELTTINTAALHNQQEQLDDLKKKLGIDYEGLDSAYAREASGWR